MDNPDIYIPLAIIAGCFTIMALAHLISRQGRNKTLAIPKVQDAVAPQPEVSADALASWHREYSVTVRAWIENHEQFLKVVSDKGLQLDLSNDLFAGHEQLARPMRAAVAAHPAPAMRAQLSAMAVASESTIHALRRSEYQNAERQHITYLQYRDQWLQRLQQFAVSDSDIAELRTLGATPTDAESLWN